MSNIQNTYQRISKPWISQLAKWIIGIFIVLGLFNKFVANEVPLISKDQSGIHFPGLNSQLDAWGLIDDKGYFPKEEQWRIMPLITYSGSQLNSAQNVRVSPLGNQEISSNRYRHWMGTDQLGRDVLAGIIDGCAVAIKVGFLAVFLALIFGVYVGLLSGYFGDKGYKINIWVFILGGLMKLITFYYLIYPIAASPSWFYYFATITILLLLILGLLKIESKLPGRQMSIPIDLISTKIIELMNSIPGLFLILAILAIMSKASIWNVIWIIALLYWPTFARYVRAEVLQLKELEYIQAAHSSGLNDWQVIYKHILPNALTSTIAISIFMVSGAILLESTLSFLGIGIPLEQVSWGSLLSEARQDLSSWWLALFPGLAIFLVLISLYVIGNDIQSKRLKA